MSDKVQRNDTVQMTELEPPRKRRRVALACDRCRERKVKCDGTKPVCEACQRRGHTPGDCVYAIISDSARLRSQRDYLLALQAHSNNESEASQSTSNLANVNVASSPLIVQLDGHPVTRGNPITSSNYSSSPQNTASVTVTSPVTAMGTSLPVSEQSQVDDRFYGSSSIVYFLNQMQHEKNDAAQMRRIQSSSTKQSNATWMLHGRYSLPPRSVCDMLLKSYFANVHIFYPLVHTKSFYDVYNRLWNAQTLSLDEIARLPDVGIGGRNSPNDTFFCALNSMLALGCENADLSPNDKATMSAVIRGRLEELLNIDLLGNADLCHAQALMLAALYFQCTNSPSRCWNAVGLACRISIGLGLHMQNASDDGVQVEVEMRRRVWHGCTQLDMMSCMALGRPPITCHRFDVPLPAAIDDSFIRTDGMSAAQPSDQNSLNHFTRENIKLLQILESILSKCYVSTTSKAVGTHETGYDTIMELNSRLASFEHALPSFLHWGKISELGSVAPVFRRQANVLHARYLHLRVLLYRPTFSRYCATQVDMIGNTRPSRSARWGGHVTESVQAQCAFSCIEAACELVTSLSNAQTQGITGAWWWSIFYTVTSAMILRVAEQHGILQDEIEEAKFHTAWNCCFKIMQGLSKEHTAATPYIDLLHTLHRGSPKCQEGCSSPISATNPELLPSRSPTVPSGNDLHLNVDQQVSYTSINDVDEPNFQEETYPLDVQGDIFLQEWPNGWQDIMCPAYVIQEFDPDQFSNLFRVS